MRRLIRWCVLLFAALLLCTGLHHGLKRDDASGQNDSAAGSGLMLLEAEQGLYVLAVSKDSPADIAGIAPGDYLLRTETECLQQPQQLDALIAAEQDVRIELLRDEDRLWVCLRRR